ncbi:MAG: hypothetical protein HFF97_00965 [Oscillibacter sp.]|jgi:hypothetical protein|nr:hypothetical protein [Oscillibacter sp.]
MKRMFALALAGLLALGLTACQNEKSVMGSLAEVQTDENGALTALVLESDGKRTGVLLAEKTQVWPRGSGSWSSQEVMEAFRRDLQPGNELSAWCYSRKEKLETAEGESIPAYWGQSISISGILKRNALTLRDGTSVDVMEEDYHGDDRTYRLSDGTELLRVRDNGGPENHYVMNLESFDDLSEAAKERVRDYYEAQGPLYDELEELEKSYAAYLQLGEAFSCDWIQQDAVPTASNDKIMYFVSSLTLPQEYGGRISYERQSGAAFDRETGEKIDNWELFAVSPEEVRRRFPELCGWVDEPELRQAMGGALDPEWFVFFPEHVSVDFPPGSLPGEGNGYIISLDYKNAPEGFFQPWAVPDGRSE